MDNTLGPNLPVILYWGEHEASPNLPPFEITGGPPLANGAPRKLQETNLLNKLFLDNVCLSESVVNTPEYRGTIE